MKRLLKFLTSLRLAIILLILVICASAVGTLIPQNRTAAEYAARYGGLAKIVLTMGLTRLYSSPWFLALLFFLGLSVLACTVTRFFSKIKRIFSAEFDVDAFRFSVPDIRDKFEINASADESAKTAKKQLTAHGYRVIEQRRGTTVSFHARKRRWGHFGPESVHAGLLVILVGGLISGLGSSRANLTFLEGQTRAIPKAGFSVRLDKFATEYYPNGSVKAWKSTLTVLDGQAAERSGIIEVNHPLSYRKFLFYQSGYGWSWDFTRLEILVTKKNDPSFNKKLLLKPGEKAELGDRQWINVVRFLPDFVLDEQNRPSSRSEEPNNPAVFLEGWSGESKTFSGWIFAKYPDFGGIRGDKEPEFAFELKDFQAPPTSIICVARDPGAGVIWAGCAILALGLSLSFYWLPREIRMVLHQAENQTEITAGGSAAKSREAFEEEFSRIVTSLRRRT